MNLTFVTFCELSLWPFYLWGFPGSSQHSGCLFSKKFAAFPHRRRWKKNLCWSRSFDELLKKFRPGSFSSGSNLLSFIISLSCYHHFRWALFCAFAHFAVPVSLIQLTRTSIKQESLRVVIFNRDFERKIFGRRMIRTHDLPTLVDNIGIQLLTKCVLWSWIHIKGASDQLPLTLGRLSSGRY